MSKPNFNAASVRRLRALIISMPAAAVAACASVQLTETGSLSSYKEMLRSDGLLTQTRQKIDKAAIVRAKSVRLEPTAILNVSPGLSAQQTRLIANAVDRSLCSGLSERFVIVGPQESADLTVRAVITHLAVTDVTAAVVSKAVNVGGTVASATTGIPIPQARVPIGLGSLSVEAEAKDHANRQIAALTWARGADSFTTKARASEDADAYALAKEFSADFSNLLVTGTDPMKLQIPSLPSSQRVREYFGEKPKYLFCEQFGRDPGLVESVGEVIGLPPSWTDKGPPAAASQNMRTTNDP